MHECPAVKSIVGSVEINRTGRVPVYAAGDLSVKMAYFLVGEIRITDLQVLARSTGERIGYNAVTVQRRELRHVVRDENQRCILGHRDRTERIYAAGIFLRQLKRSVFNDQASPCAVG